MRARAFAGRVTLTALLVAIMCTVVLTSVPHVDAATLKVRTHTVSATKLCSTFGQRYLTCAGGYANAAGTLTKYQVRGKDPAGIRTITLLKATSTTCRSLKFTFWAVGRYTHTVVRVVTPSFTYRGATRGTHLGTVVAKLGKKPFVVRLTMHRFGTGHVYIFGHATCTSKSGE